LLADDIYSTFYKAAGVLLYGIAIAMPVGLRSPWWATAKRVQYVGHRGEKRLKEILPYGKA
jgi:hypothetical protein